MRELVEKHLPPEAATCCLVELGGDVAPNVGGSVADVSIAVRLALMLENVECH